jgi:16S rRNA (guanine527-N7)-methyltransferase
MDPLGATVLSARALAPLARLCSFAERHLAAGGTCLFPKGQQFEQEIEVARRDWSFDITVHPSQMEPGAATLEIKGLSRV